MPDHTPAPWVVGGPKYRDPNCIVIHTPAGESIASAWNLTFVEGREPATPIEANARLIAAAPDLLAACEHLLTFIKRFDMGGDWEQSNYPEVRTARAAIRKAREG